MPGKVDLCFEHKFMGSNDCADGSRRRYIDEEVGKFGEDKVPAHAFTYQEVIDATQNFNIESLLGEGGFGRVYKGHLESKNKVVSLSLILFTFCCLTVTEKH